MRVSSFRQTASHLAWLSPRQENKSRSPDSDLGQNETNAFFVLVAAMKYRFLLLSLAGFAIACSSKSTADAPNCPLASPPAVKVSYEGDFYDSLQIQEIVANTDTLTFQSRKYHFTLCRGNSTWNVTASTDRQSDEASLQQLANPPYQTVELSGKSYQYRVLLDPNPFPDFQVEPKRAVMELIKPGTTQPQRQVLYTLEQVKAQQAGIQLGVPSITATAIYGDRLYWAISPEQGEGNGGIATIVSYNPKNDDIRLIQPPEIARQQINDLAIAGNSEYPTFWLATQVSGEGNPYLPGMGLVVYHPAAGSYQAEYGFEFYHARNSPLVGVIPHQLHLEGEWLWVGTGNGICQVKWQMAAQTDQWRCWRFVLKAQLPSQGISLYPSLLAKESVTTLKPQKAQETVEVLWWSPQDVQTRQGRYEIAYTPGFTVTLPDQGATLWTQFYHGSRSAESWEAPVYWAGKDWIWQGDRFVRPFDAVALNAFGGGPLGISTWRMPQQTRPELYAIRGDLNLLKLTKTSTQVQYQSAWVSDKLLQPYLTVTPDKPPPSVKPNPLEQ